MPKKPSAEAHKWEQLRELIKSVIKTKGALRAVCIQEGWDYMQAWRWLSANPPQQPKPDSMFKLISYALKNASPKLKTKINRFIES